MALDRLPFACHLCPLPVTIALCLSPHCPCVHQLCCSLLLGLHAEKQQFEGELVHMIENHRSFPSVVMYVVFNEGWGQYEVRLSVCVMHVVNAEVQYEILFWQSAYNQ